MGCFSSVSWYAYFLSSSGCDIFRHTPLIHLLRRSAAPYVGFAFSYGPKYHCCHHINSSYHPRDACKKKWHLMALLFLPLITSWINGRILDQPIYWRNVETEPASQEELKAIRDLVKSRTKYNMKVLDAYKVHSPSQEKHFQNYQKLLHSKNHPSEPTQLFHGTSFYSARNIVANGFKIGHGGMFGGGIYFAKTPRKSMNFCTARSGKRVMLLCDVLMGNSRIIKTAKNDLDPKKDLSMKKYRLAHWGPVFYLESTMRSYDSVSAVPSVLFPFLSVQTPEFVVYKKEQIIPRYVLVVEPPR